MRISDWSSDVCSSDLAKAGQVVGNFNNLFMLRVRETATAELLTRQLPKVEVYATALMSGATDSSDPHGNTAFTSNTQDRISTTSRTEEHTSELQSLMRISYAVFRLYKKIRKHMALTIPMHARE